MIRLTIKVEGPKKHLAKKYKILVEDLKHLRQLELSEIVGILSETKRTTKTTKLGIKSLRLLFHSRKRCVPKGFV